MGNQRILRQVKGKLVNFIQDRRRVCAARSPHLPPTLSSPSPSPLVLRRRSPATGDFQVPVNILNLLSGACIPLANKCNSKIDCFEDESDESHCSYLEVQFLKTKLQPGDNNQVPPNYAGQLSPRSTGSEAVPVFVNVSILAFPV